MLSPVISVTVELPDFKFKVRLSKNVNNFRMLKRQRFQTFSVKVL